MNDNHHESIVRVEGVTREYQRGGGTVAALRGVDLRIVQGEGVAVMGPSGCGKSTLLGLIGGLDRPSAGAIFLGNRNLVECSRVELARLRRTAIGYIPQNNALLPMLTVAENVELPLALVGEPHDSRGERVRELLERVDMLAKMHALPEELSGGQQQRVAIARALAARPRLLLADEPAGSLDSLTARSVLQLIAEEARREGTALLLVTHEADEARYADRVVRMRDGLVVAQEAVA